MRSFLLIIVLVLLFSTVGWAQQHISQSSRVFITAGQYNTDGRTNSTLIPDATQALTSDSTYYTDAYPYWPKRRTTKGLWI